MARHRLGEREIARLVHIGREAYLLIPGEKGDEYQSLVRKGLVALTVSRSHKTLRTGKEIVDIWRVELTEHGKGVAAVIERDSRMAYHPTAEDLEGDAATVALDMAALFESYDAGEDYV